MLINKKLYKLIIFSFFILIFMMSKAEANMEIKKFLTKNKVEVFYVNSSTIPMVDIQVIFDAGSNKDNKLNGLSNLTHGLINEGTKNKKYDEISYELESNGAIFSASSYKDKSIISLRSLTQENYFKNSVKIFAEILSSANFPKEQFEIQKNQLISFIKEGATDPSDVSINLFYKSLYGKHPYANPNEGYVSSIERISRKDVMNFYNSYIIRQNAKIVIVGSLKFEEIKKLAEKISISLNSSTNKNNQIHKGEIQSPSKKNFFKKLNSEQSHIYIGQHTIKRGDNRNFPLYVANYIFGGGGFSSKLMKEIRVKRGYAYSVYSYIYPLKSVGPMAINLETKHSQAKDAINTIHEMLNQYISKGPTKKEVEDAKNAIINKFPLRVSSNKDILNYISMIAYYDLPLDYLVNFEKNIQSVTPKNIKDALKEVLLDENFITVVVGNENPF